MSLTGLFSNTVTDSPLSFANKVFIRYCTSDAHMGNAGPSESTFGWHFRGQIVVDSVFTDLLATRGLGAGDTVIYGGGSAGARGAMVHMDYIREMLTGVGVSVVGFLDSPYWMDNPPYTGRSDPTFPGFPVVTQAVFAMANVSQLGRSCSVHYPGSEGWKCMFGVYRMPFLRTPLLMVASQVRRSTAAQEAQRGTRT